MSDVLTAEAKAELKSIIDGARRSFDDEIKRLDRQADEKWDELKKSPDAVLGESLKTLLKDRETKAEERGDAIEKALTDRMDEMEAKAKLGGAAGGSTESQFTKAVDDFFEAGGYKPKAKGDTAHLTIPVKAVTTLTTSTSNDEDRTGPTAGLRQYPQDPLTLASLVAPGTIDGFYFKYERELLNSQQGGAGYQLTEGALKPNMDIKTELVTEEVATIAVTSRVSQQIFDDRAAFVSFLKMRMGYSVEKLLDREVLNGAGGDGEITGVNTVATAFNTALVGQVMTDQDATVQRIDAVRLARLQVELANYAPDGTALHPSDWAGMELRKDNDAHYLIGDPRTGNASGIGRVGSVWGMPVVTTAGQALGDFTVGDWRGGAQLFMRKALEILASTEDQDNFVKNLVTLRAELRALLAVYSALAFTTGDFASAIAAGNA